MLLLRSHCFFATQALIAARTSLFYMARLRALERSRTQSTVGVVATIAVIAVVAPVAVVAVAAFAVDYACGSRLCHHNINAMTVAAEGKTTNAKLQTLSAKPTTTTNVATSPFIHRIKQLCLRHRCRQQLYHRHCYNKHYPQRFDTSAATTTAMVIIATKTCNGIFAAMETTRRLKLFAFCSRLIAVRCLNTHCSQSSVTLQNHNCVYSCCYSWCRDYSYGPAVISVTRAVANNGGSDPKCQIGC